MLHSNFPVILLPSEHVCVGGGETGVRIRDLGPAARLAGSGGLRNRCLTSRPVLTPVFTGPEEPRVGGPCRPIVALSHQYSAAGAARSSGPLSACLALRQRN